MMANNRLQIYCRKCLQLEIVAKYYPTEWYVHTEDLVNKLNDFLQAHSLTCHQQDGQGMFGLRTEDDQDGFISDYTTPKGKLVRKEEIKDEKESLPNNEGEFGIGMIKGK